MNTLTRENRADPGAQAEQFVAPPASVIEAGDGYRLEVEMPGVNKDGLDISVENNELTIIGRRSLPVVESPVRVALRIWLALGLGALSACMPARPPHMASAPPAEGEVVPEPAPSPLPPSIQEDGFAEAAVAHDGRL